MTNGICRKVIVLCAPPHTTTTHGARGDDAARDGADELRQRLDERRRRRAVVDKVEAALEGDGRGLRRLRGAALVVEEAVGVRGELAEEQLEDHRPQPRLARGSEPARALRASPGAGQGPKAGLDPNACQGRKAGQGPRAGQGP